jgi:hypothetical protein
MFLPQPIDAFLDRFGQLLAAHIGGLGDVHQSVPRRDGKALHRVEDLAGRVHLEPVEEGFHLVGHFCGVDLRDQSLNILGLPGEHFGLIVGLERDIALDVLFGGALALELIEEDPRPLEGGASFPAGHGGTG